MVVVVAKGAFTLVGFGRANDRGVLLERSSGATRTHESVHTCQQLVKFRQHAET